MAAAAASPLTSSVEKTNGAKLRRLLIDGGTTVLRNVFDSYHPPVNLAADLNANYPTLNNLLRRRVLRSAQWDQLFPPGGAAPDSNTFDITLLFLLLTNICGLAPPPSGWHTKPPPSDTSREANLARIKFFRNELYGHVSTTGVDAPTFTSLWQEISAVHVALGLNQAEIDRLKAEHCGEEDYLDVLLDWADSDEDIKSQLKEIRQCQTETQQDVSEVLQAQLEDRKAREGNKAKLEDVHHTQTNIQGTIEKVRQTQLEDHKTLRDNKSKLDEVHQTENDIQETLERVHKTQTKTQGIVEGVVKTQEKHSEALQAVKQTVDSLKEKRDEDREEEVVQNLAKSEFKGDIEYHVGRFQEGTREWVFNKVQDWLDDRNSQNRVIVITANAGMGKSVISAVICRRMQEAGRLSGSHFCQHNNARYRNPQLMLQSLACHLCHALPKYKQILAKQLSRNLGEDLNHMGVEELFALLFKEPLSTVADPGRNMLMVIDGLDESEYQERNELLDVIANHFCKLPCWIRFLCTTRPERNIVEALKQLKPFQLEPNEEENVQDIKLFLETGTQHLIREGRKDAIVEKLVEKSEGLMLYAYFLVSFLKENVSILDQGDVDGNLPLAISSVYRSYFKRLENELIKELGVKEENFLKLLCAVTASREPLPIDFVSKVLVPSANSPVARRKVLKAIGSVSSLLPIRDGCLHIFHKSVNDWLTDISSYGEHDFTVDEKEGHHILASLCSDELDDLKQKVVRDTLFSTTEKYALHHGVRHMLLLDEDMKSGSLEKCVQTYVIDLELLYAKLCINDSLAAEDILWLQSHEISQSLSEDSKALLSTLTILLRKYFNTITNHPLVFFQTVLNEGGTVLSSMASNLLQNKYLDIPYMEFVHKQVQQGGVLARFQCSSQVACFDVSPQLDYMVCECRDETIQLWSLDTGKLVWTHPVMVKKPYIFGTFRRSISSPVFSLYRSVVFHPTAAVVLPGVLSHAYTFDGNLKLLFPESKCRFTVCSISGDKIKMLTDCPDDAKCILMWSLESGSEIFRITRIEDVLSFAWSRDEKLLAISHCTGSICFADVEDGGRILVQTVTPEVCGMIKFSPDCESLFCCHLSLSDLKESLFRLSINMAEHVTCWSDVLGEYYMYLPWEFESQSIGGFLLGDPLTSLFDTSSLAVFDWTFDFVLNKQTVLRGYPQDVFIDMLNINELRPLETDKKAKPTSIKEIVFSLSGETIYTVSKDAVTKLPTARAWNVTSWKHIAKKSIEKIEEKRWSPWFRGKATYLVAVNKGILLTTRMGALEMWNFKLSNCVRCWTDLCGITQMIPISEERVACVASLEYGKKVIILDTTSGEIMSEISIGYSNFIACNSKCEVLTWKSRSFELLHGSTTVWEKYLRFSRHRVSKLTPDGMFSPKGRFVITWAMQLMYVLDAVSGKPLHILCSGPFLDSDCKFISDEECVISFITALRGYCLRLFNVKSGDLLSVIDLERQVDCLAACPRKRLLAIGQKHSKHGFQLIQVRLPQDKDSRESKSMVSTAVIEERRENKRMANTPETKDSTDNERGLDNLDVLEGKQATGTSLKRREESPSYSSSKRSKLTPDHPAVAVIKEGTPENADLERLAQ